MKTLLRYFCLSLVLAGLLHAEMRSLVVLVPAGHDKARPLPVVVWLHGYMANPATLTEEPLYQAVADDLHVAFVGVPATREKGADSFVWSEVPEFDLERIEAALREAAARSGCSFDRRILVGFSQGAAVAAEVAARNPTRFEGAILLSPGANTAPYRIPRAEGNSSQIFCISTGAKEHPSNISFARQYRSVLLGLEAKVVYREVEGMSEHRRPPDWAEVLPAWLTEILAPKAGR